MVVVVTVDVMVEGEEEEVVVLEDGRRRKPSVAGENLQMGP